MRVFGYDDAVLERYPDIVGGMILARGVTNGPTPADLLDHYQAEQQAVLERIGETPLSQIEPLAAWRRAFRGFGVDPTQYRCAAEALLRRLTKKGDIPSINLLVDAGNLVSIRYALPIAVFDRRAINGPITVRFAEGTERFGELGEREAVHPEPGEVVFTDERDQVIARRWCWRQSESSAASESTSECLITIEGHHPAARADMEQAVADLLELLDEFAGGTYASDVLDRNHPWLVEGGAK